MLFRSAGPAGYTASAWGCTGTGGSLSGSNITLALGASVTCTITNNDQTAHLKLVKSVVNDNGGTATASNWTLSASGPTALSGAGVAESDVNAGSYTLSESAGPAGYTASTWSCTNGVTVSGGSITLALGQIVWGVAYRCAPTRDLWDRLPVEQRGVVVPLPDAEPRVSEAYRNLVLPEGAVLARQTAGIALYRSAAPDPRSASRRRPRCGVAGLR